MDKFYHGLVSELPSSILFSVEIGSIWPINSSQEFWNENERMKIFFKIKETTISKYHFQLQFHLDLLISK